MPRQVMLVEGEVEQFYEDLQDLLELTPKNIYPFLFFDINLFILIGG